MKSILSVSKRDFFPAENQERGYQEHVFLEVDIYIYINWTDFKHTLI